jgi:hypothetical protein
VGGTGEDRLKFGECLVIQLYVDCADGCVELLHGARPTIGPVIIRLVVRPCDDPDMQRLVRAMWWTLSVGLEQCLGQRASSTARVVYRM